MALINDFLSLIYPRYCEACEENLFKHEDLLCNKCLLTLPKGRYHLQTHNELELLFAGRIPTISVMSLFVYQKCGRVQKILHAIKYQQQKELARFAGKLFAGENEIKNTLSGVDFVLPIPLHKNKLKVRGYNQSQLFAEGICSTLNIPLDAESLTRVRETSTQTKKRKYQRWENVEGIFEVAYPTKLEGKHVLLVDDVITTGATLEAAWQALKHCRDIKISIASIAFAGKLI